MNLNKLQDPRSKRHMTQFPHFLLSLIVMAFSLTAPSVYSSDSPVTAQQYELIDTVLKANSFKIRPYGTPNLTIRDKNDIPAGMITASEPNPSTIMEDMIRKVGTELISTETASYQLGCFENYKGRERSHFCICFFIELDFAFFLSFPPNEEQVFVKIVQEIHNALGSK